MILLLRSYVNAILIGMDVLPRGIIPQGSSYIYSVPWHTSLLRHRRFKLYHPGRPSSTLWVQQHPSVYTFEGRLCEQVKIYINTDSTAAKPIASRYGVARRTIHIELKYKLLQHLLNANLVKINNIPGESNISDIFTKCVSSDVLQRHLGDV